MAALNPALPSGFDFGARRRQLGGGQAQTLLADHIRDGNQVASPGTAISSSVNARMITT